MMPIPTEARMVTVSPFLDYRGVISATTTERALFEALKSFGPMGALINTTMEEARPIAELGQVLFGKDVPQKRPTKPSLY